MQKIYTCNATLNRITKPPTVASVTTNHSNGQSNNDVEAFRILKQKSIEFIPRDIGKFFPNLLAFEIISSGLRFLCRNDLKGMDNLIALNLPYNRITFITYQAFDNNLKLRSISFYENPIIYIAPGVFEILPECVNIHFEYSKCMPTDNVAERNQSSLKALIERIKKQCPPSEKMIADEAARKADEIAIQ